ncbi:MAG: hypothetical protein NKF70_10175 [Methanobacterium sp. ERen5]|nr:MAG: hypothetical protein NKF70_10175 [Methanobacterium sp. ERen5]
MLNELKKEFDNKYEEIMLISDDPSSPEYDNLFDEIEDLNSKMMEQILKIRRTYYLMPEPRI